MRLSRTVPALPVAQVAAAVRCYTDQFGFAVRHREDSFAIVVRDEAELHLWQADDDGWRHRPGPELAVARVRHPTTEGGPQDTTYGTREFATLDVDGNLLTFYRPD